MARIFFLCLAAACCCLALLPPPPPAQGRRPGLQQAAGGGLGGRRRLHLLLPVPEQPHFEHATEVCYLCQEAAEQQRGVPVMRKARPAWSPVAAAGSGVRPELRAVPGGPDPLHHHGGSPSRRPEQDRTKRSP